MHSMSRSWSWDRRLLIIVTVHCTFSLESLNEEAFHRLLPLHQARAYDISSTSSLQTTITAQHHSNTSQTAPYGFDRRARHPCITHNTHNRLLNLDTSQRSQSASRSSSRSHLSMPVRRLRLYDKSWSVPRSPQRSVRHSKTSLRPTTIRKNEGSSSTRSRSPSRI